MQEATLRFRRESQHELTLRHKDASKELEGAVAVRLEESCEISTRTDLPNDGRTAGTPQRTGLPRDVVRLAPVRPPEHSAR